MREMERTCRMSEKYEQVYALIVADRGPLPTWLTVSGTLRAGYNIDHDFGPALELWLKERLARDNPGRRIHTVVERQAGGSRLLRVAIEEIVQ